MVNRVAEVFTDERFILYLKKGLPYLFRIAELENMRSGKIGMEVGTLRERVLIALFIHYFGQENICVGPITESETDVSVFGKPISIKTITSRTFSGVKAIWTVDAGSALHFVENYSPSCDLLLTRINWGGTGGIYLIPLEVQQSFFCRAGRQSFFKLPKPGTNPRGVEYDRDVLQKMAECEDSVMVTIRWERPDLSHNVYDRWVTEWGEVLDKFMSSQK